MRFEYRRFRTALMMFALGLAAVYMWRGLLIGMNEVPVDLPKIRSGDEVLTVFPSDEPPDYTGYRDRAKQILDSRDMSLYDTGGLVQSCAYEASKECLLKRDAARQFVFDHWKQQRRGYIQVGFPCTDCGPVDHIFVEPDKNGQWIITITLATNGPLETTRSVKARFKKPNRDDWRWDGSSRMLSFVDKSGHEADAF